MYVYVQYNYILINKFNLDVYIYSLDVYIYTYIYM